MSYSSSSNFSYHVLDRFNISSVHTSDGWPERARLQLTADHAVKQLSICRLLLIEEHRFLILPSYPNKYSILIVLSYAENYLSHVFHLTPFLSVMLSRRQAMRCLATKLGHRLTYFCIQSSKEINFLMAKGFYQTKTPSLLFSLLIE